MLKRGGINGLACSLIAQVGLIKSKAKKENKPHLEKLIRVEVLFGFVNTVTRFLIFWFNSIIISVT